MKKLLSKIDIDAVLYYGLLFAIIFLAVVSSNYFAITLGFVASMLLMLVKHYVNVINRLIDNSTVTKDRLMEVVRALRNE